MLFLQMCEKEDLKNLQQSKILRCSHCRINHLCLELRVAAGYQRYKALVSVSAVSLKSNAELSDQLLLHESPAGVHGAGGNRHGHSF